MLPDDALNVFITLTAKGLHAGVRVLARAENPASEKKLLRSGAATVVLARERSGRARSPPSLPAPGPRTCWPTPTPAPTCGTSWPASA